MDIRRTRIALIFVLIVFAVSLAYNLWVPRNYWCNNGGIERAVIILTAPINIGCESPPVDMFTGNGAVNVFGNLIWVAILLAWIEYIERYEICQILRFMFCAILATYLTEVISYSFEHTGAAGTSIIGISAATTIWWHYAKTVLGVKNRIPRGLIIVGLVTGMILIVQVYGQAGVREHVVGLACFCSLCWLMGRINIEDRASETDRISTLSASI